jgi:hypothetical protein
MGSLGCLGYLKVLLGLFPDNSHSANFGSLPEQWQSMLGTISAQKAILRR